MWPLHRSQTLRRNSLRNKGPNSREKKRPKTKFRKTAARSNKELIATWMSISPDLPLNFPSFPMTRRNHCTPRHEFRIRIQITNIRYHDFRNRSAYKCFLSISFASFMEISSSCAFSWHAPVHTFFSDKFPSALFFLLLGHNFGTPDPRACGHAPKFNLTSKQRGYTPAWIFPGSKPASLERGAQKKAQSGRS